MKWQKKSATYLRQGLSLMEKRKNLKDLHEKTIEFNLEKVSERYVKKLDALLCVY